MFSTQQGFRPHYLKYGINKVNEEQRLAEFALKYDEKFYGTLMIQDFKYHLLSCLLELRRVKVTSRLDLKEVILCAVEGKSLSEIVNDAVGNPEVEALLGDMEVKRKVWMNEVWIPSKLKLSTVYRYL